MRDNKVFLKGLGNKEVAIYKNYASLKNGQHVILAISMLASNNFVLSTTVNILLDVAKLSHKRYVISSLDYLIDNRFIAVEGDYSKANNNISIEILQNDNEFGLINGTVALDMCKDLDKKELNVAFALYSHLNSKHNYVYPSLEEIRYLMNEDDDRYIKKIKNKLLEQGYIKCILPIFNKLVTVGKHTTNIPGTRSTLNGYFLRTDTKDILDEKAFAKNMIDKKNDEYLKSGSRVRWSFSNSEFISNNKFIDKYLCDDFKNEKEVKENDNYEFVSSLEHEDVANEKETVNEVEIESESKTINVAYKVNLEKLLNDNYPGFITHKKLKEYVEKYGHEKMFDFFLDNYTERQIYSINANDDFHRANIFYKNKIDNLFDKFLEEEQAIEFSKKIILPDPDYIEDIYIPNKYVSNPRRGLAQIIKEVSVKQPEK